MSNSNLTIRGGRYAGETLYSPDNAGIRPMRSRIREAVFARISDQLQDQSVLDCFAGTGAMGLEALSRGASRAVFIDRSPQAISCIQQNIEKIDPAGATRIIQCDLLTSRPKIDDDAPFQFISVTPPYRFFKEPDPRRQCVEFLEEMSQRRYLTDTGSLIVECEQGTRFGRAPGPLERVDHSTFGKTDLHWFRSVSS